MANKLFSLNVDGNLTSRMCFYISPDILTQGSWIYNLYCESEQINDVFIFWHILVSRYKLWVHTEYEHYGVEVFRWPLSLFVYAQAGSFSSNGSWLLQCFVLSEIKRILGSQYVAFSLLYKTCMHKQRATSLYSYWLLLSHEYLTEDKGIKEINHLRER